MHVVAWSRSLTPERGGTRHRLSPDDHRGRQRLRHPQRSHRARRPTRAAHQRRRLRGDDARAYFINTSRAEVVDQAALNKRSKQGIRAGLDVFAGEPTSATGDFADEIVKFRTFTARITSALRPIRRRKRSPPRPCASSARSKKPARCRTWSTWPIAHRRHICWSCAISDRPGVLATSSMRSKQRNQCAGDGKYRFRRR